MSSRRDEEERAFDRVVRHLVQRFPDLPVTAVSAAVRAEKHRLSESRVRDFLPLLVERAAAARLRAQAPHSQAR